MFVTNSLVLLSFQKLLDAWVNDFRDAGSLFGKSKGSAVDGVTIKASMDIGEVLLETGPHIAVMFVLFFWIKGAVIMVSLITIEPNSISLAVQKHGQGNIVSIGECLLLRLTLVTILWSEHLESKEITVFSGTSVFNEIETVACWSPTFDVNNFNIF